MLSLVGCGSGVNNNFATRNPTSQKQEVLHEKTPIQRVHLPGRPHEEQTPLAI